MSHRGSSICCSLARWDRHRTLGTRPMSRFTIRELMLLTVLVAMGLAWFLDRRGRFHVAEGKAAFWKNCAVALQGQLEQDGYKVEVGQERGITITDPAGKSFY